jgi:hypothetical protein
MSARTSWPFMGALLSAGAFGVHQLRYAIAFGGDAKSALGASGHAYLTLVEPLIGLSLAFALAHLVWRISGGGRRLRLNRPRLAALFAVALLVVYTGQELLEGELAAGHAQGLAGVFGAGGWVAVPLAVTLGALLSLAVRLADAAADAAVLRGTLMLRRITLDSTWSAAGPLPAATTSPLERHLAGRAPPAVLPS